MRRQLACLVMLMPLAAGASERQSAAQAAWQALGTGAHVVLMRHAATEAGVGDPPDFRKDDCSTQRNLSSAGRAQARGVGEQFKRRAIAVEEVWSSRWCRCLDTARLAFGQAQKQRMLDSMFNDPEGNDEAGKAAQVQSAVSAWMTRRQGQRGNLVLVTHNINIARLTGVSTANAEIVVARPDATGKLQVVGRIPIEN